MLAVKCVTYDSNVNTEKQIKL